MYFGINICHRWCLDQNDTLKRTTSLLFDWFIFSCIWKLICVKLSHKSFSKLVHSCKHSWNHLFDCVSKPNINDIGSCITRTYSSQKSIRRSNKKFSFCRSNCYLSSFSSLDIILQIKTQHSTKQSSIKTTKEIKLQKLIKKTVL